MHIFEIHKVFKSTFSYTTLSVAVGLNPFAVIQTSDIAPVSSKEFLDIQATTECRSTLKLVRDMIMTYSLIYLSCRWFL